MICTDMDTNNTSVLECDIL